MNEKIFHLPQKEVVDICIWVSFGSVWKEKKENMFSGEVLTTALVYLDLGPKILGGPKRFQAEI